MGSFSAFRRAEARGFWAADPQISYLQCASGSAIRLIDQQRFLADKGVNEAPNAVLPQ